MDIAPTSKHAADTGVGTGRYLAGKVVEAWAGYDTLGSSSSWAWSIPGSRRSFSLKLIPLLRGGQEAASHKTSDCGQQASAAGPGHNLTRPVCPALRRR
jgi:hypothetical protein